MPEQDKINLNYCSENLDKINSLRDFLTSEISINPPQEGKIIITINVRNSAPKNPEGGEVVFIGVGLHIIDNSESGVNRGFEYWQQKIKISRLLYFTDFHQPSKEGTWFGTGAGESPSPNLTFDENSHGEVLFPGEIIEYQLRIDEADLPYLDIRVEGSVSQRHLFHISRPIYELKKWHKILVNETFLAIDKIDFFTPLVSIIKDAPILGVKTTIADINKLKAYVEKGLDIIDELRAKLNGVYESTQHRVLRDYMEKGIGNYLNSVAKAFETTSEALSSGDTGSIKQATDEMMRKVLVETEELKLQRANLISKFDIETKPGLLRRLLTKS
jgi:hypothetical protein